MRNVIIDCFGNRNDLNPERFNSMSGKKHSHLIDEASETMADFMGTLGSGLVAARREYERRLHEAQSEGSEGGEKLSSNEKADLKRLQQIPKLNTLSFSGGRRR